MLPGFVDAHTHLTWQGIGLAAIDIAAATSVDHALELIALGTRDAPDGWIDVSGYDQRNLGRHLGAKDLDAVSFGSPIQVRHVSGHASVVNSLVLEQLDRDALANGQYGIDRDGSGVPSGLFLEDAQEIIRNARPPATLQEVIDSLRRSTALCARQGITSCIEAGVGAGLIHFSRLEPTAFRRLAADGELPVRVQLMVAADFLRAVGDEWSMDLDLSTGFGGERVSLGAAKFWLDGGMSARTAALSEPYDGVGGRGDLTPDLEQYRQISAGAHAAGWQLALHAIGDLAVDTALDLIEAAARRAPRSDARPRIEHCGLVRPDQLGRIARSGAIAVIQPTFLKDFGDDYARIMGAGRANWMYRGRTFLDHGIPVAGSSDRPVTDGDPMAAISFMVNRRSSSGLPIGADEAMSIEDAIRAYTTGAAFAGYLENRVGTLSTGKLADLVVLGADPHVVDSTELEHVPVLATVLGGEPTFDPDQLLPLVENA